MTTGNVFVLRPRRLPQDVRKTLELLLAHVDDQERPIAGIAFVAYIDDAGYIAEAVGRARDLPGETRKMLRKLDSKLERMERAT